MSESLVIVSKVKKIVKAAGMSTSATVVDALTKVVEKELHKAIENAKKEKRKTVMDRDFRCESGTCSY
jgi:histone H3/H4